MRRGHEKGNMIQGAWQRELEKGADDFDRGRWFLGASE